MIVVKLQGGLGNQLFQYAAGRALSEKYFTHLALDTSFYARQELRTYSLDAFAISAELATPADIAHLKVIREKGFSFDAGILESGPDAHIEGYFQSEKYFKDIEPIIRKEFTLRESPGAHWTELHTAIQAGTAVSLHIRRGDYLFAKHQNIYEQLSLEYYQQAVDLISKQASGCTFFVFSDDIEWAKENISLPFPTEYVSGNDLADYEELLLMSACMHNITANSSFSWWGAWLNGNPEKIVVTPKRWFVDGRSETDLIPPSWIRL